MKNRAAAHSCILLLPLFLAGPPAGAVTEPVSVEELWRSGDYRAAEVAAQELVAELERRHGPDPRELAEALDHLVRAALEVGRAAPPEVLRAARRAVAMCEDLLPPSDPRCVSSLLHLAGVHRRRAELESARAALERARLLLEERGEAANESAAAEAAAALTELGRLEVAAGRWRQAEVAFGQALERSGGPGPLGALLGLGRVLLNKGDLAASRPFFERAVELARGRDEEHPDYGLALAGLAHQRFREGDYEQAREDFERAVALLQRRLGTPSDVVATVRNDLARARRYMGDRTGAIEAAQRALAVQETLLGAEHPDVAETRNNLGGTFAELGDFESSREHFERALAIVEANLKPDDPQIGRAHANLGRLHVARQDPVAARRHYDRALAILTASYGEDHPQLAVLLSGLAQLDADEGRLAEARAGFEKVLRIRERSLGPDHPLVALDLRQVARAARAAGDLAAAADAAARSLEIREKRFGPDHPDVAVALHELAAVELLAGRRRDALAHAVRSAEILSEYLSDALPGVSERQGLRQIQNLPEPEETLFAGLVSAGEDADAWLEACWNWTVRRRGRVLEEMAARHRAGALGRTPAVQAAWGELAATREELAELLLDTGSADAEYRQRLAAARRRKEEAERALSRASERFRRRALSGSVDFEAVRQALPPSAALVEIVRVPLEPGAKPGEQLRHDVALLLGPDGEPSFADLGRSRDVDRLVSEWRRALHASRPGAEPEANGGGEEESRLAGEALRELLWDAVSSRLEHAEMVLWVLDGGLHDVPLAALPDGDRGYLIESPPAHHVLGAARDLVLLQAERGRRKGRGLLVLGAPDFEAGSEVRLAGIEPEALQGAFRGALSECPAMKADSWRPLPESYREIIGIDALFGGREPVSLLHGAQASEERLKLEAPGKRLLHLATHGFFLPPSCRDGPLDNPLLHSGLVLAGANRRHTDGGGLEDGLLTAEELAALDLSSVELAVLSACDTGRGDVKVGEGVFGLRRALRISGVRSVVMSLWPVPDRSARRWMSSFYRSLLAGGGLLDASREASLALLERLRDEGSSAHPYHWAGFVAAGDWR